MLIKNDVFDIASRLKEIDNSYYIIFNPEKKRFEVHSSEIGKSSLCFVVPFDRLDKRTIDYALKTRVQNIKKLEKEIEENNKKISGS